MRIIDSTYRRTGSVDVPSSSLPEGTLLYDHVVGEYHVVSEDRTMRVIESYSEPGQAVKQEYFYNGEIIQKKISKRVEPSEPILVRKKRTYKAPTSRIQW